MGLAVWPGNQFTADWERDHFSWTRDQGAKKKHCYTGVCNVVKMLLRRILCVILVCICYFTIAPLALDVPDSREWAQFVDFMTRYNKSYRHNSTVVLQRFTVFQVVEWASDAHIKVHRHHLMWLHFLVFVGPSNKFANHTFQRERAGGSSQTATINSCIAETCCDQSDLRYL